MGFGLILAGLAFFVIPSAGMIDVMPDFIGCALIMRGLLKLSELSGDLENARYKFRYLFYLTLLRAVMIIPLAMIGDEMTTMLFVFSFAVAETVFLILAANSLIEGVNYVSFRHGCDIKETRYNDIKVVFTVFIILRELLVALPELAVLTNNAYKDTIDVTDLYKPTLYESKTLILLICLGISLSVGIIFYISAARYFSVPAKDKALNKALAEEYGRIYEDGGVRFTYKNLKKAAILMTAGVAFLCTLHFYGFDVLFDFIGFVFICAGYGVLSKYSDHAKTALKISAGAAAVSVATAALSVYTSLVHYHKSYVLTVGAVWAYTLLAVLQTVSYILFAFSMLWLYRALCDIVFRYVKSPVFDENGYKTGFCKKYLYYTVAGAALCPVCSLFGFLYMYNEEIWTVGFAVFFAYAVYTLKTLLTLPNEIERSL